MRLQEIYAPIRGGLDQVDTSLAGELERILLPGRSSQEYASYATRRVRHLLQTRGKLLRPSLVLFAWRLAERQGGPFPQDVLSVATAVELIHMASLVHDDIIDGSVLRRGKPSVNSAFGNRSAVLVGDILYAQFFTRLTEIPFEHPERENRLFSLFSTTTRTMCLGELCEQKALESSGPVSADDYVAILEQKTASLMSACCASGAILAGACQREEEALAEFGREFGIGFQLVDDRLDRDAPEVAGMDLQACAKEHLGRAQAVLQKLRPGECLRMLQSLAEYVGTQRALG